LRLLRLGEAGKTEVMYTVKLTHAQTQRYLSRLVELGLVESPDETVRTPGYRITRKGLDILSKIEEVQEMLRVDELSAILDSPRLETNRRGRRDALSRLRDVIRGGRDRPKEH
jgi:predicted transcriptional regulator